MMDYYSGHMLGWGFGGLIMLIFWIGVVVLVAWLISEMLGYGQRHHNQSDALEILKQRYAKGEIGKEEFESKRKDINN